jgi:hypothetical protein
MATVKKSYKGSDLSAVYVSKTRKYLNGLAKELEQAGCTNVEFNINFNYWSGFITAPNGQVWYLSAHNNNRYMYRTAKNYRDFTGGSNQLDQNILRAIQVDIIENS